MSPVVSKTEIKEWFEKRFREWRASQTTRKAGITQFAGYIGISREVLNSYMLRGSSPEGENLARVGEKYPEIYHLLGLQHPNPVLKAINAAWNKVPEDVQKKAAALILRSAGELDDEDQANLNALFEDSEREAEKLKKSKGDRKHHGK